MIPLNDKASQLYLSRTYGYHPNMNCKVTIRVPLGEQVIATFRELSIHNSYRCNDHRLEILDGPWNSTKKLSGNFKDDNNDDDENDNNDDDDNNNEYNNDNDNNMSRFNSENVYSLVTTLEEGEGVGIYVAFNSLGRIATI